VGQRSLVLDKILVRHLAGEWAFLTPCNPGSKVLSKEDNDKRIKAFSREITRFTHWEAFGVDPERKWPAEFSFLMAGLSRQEASDLAIRFGQNAFLYGKIFRAAELVWIG